MTPCDPVDFWVKESQKAVEHVLAHIGKKKKTANEANKIVRNATLLTETLSQLKEFLPVPFESVPHIHALDSKRPSIPPDFIRAFLLIDKKTPASVDTRKSITSRTGKVFDHPTRYIVRDIKRNHGLELLSCIWDYRYQNTPAEWDEKETGKRISEPRKIKIAYRRLAWALCDPLDGHDTTVRVDFYGNVIAWEVAPCSLFSVQFDHIFPWCKGGRQSDGNVVALHYYANSLKSSDWTFTKTRRDLVTGVPTRMFKEMVRRTQNLVDSQGNMPFKDLKNAIRWVVNRDWYKDLNEALATLDELGGTNAKWLSSKFGGKWPKKCQEIVSRCRKENKGREIRLQALYCIRGLIPDLVFYQDLAHLDAAIVERLYQIVETHRVY